MQNYVSFIAVQAIYSRGKHMTEMTKTDIQRVALKEAEDELCALGHTLVNEGWDTTTIAMTLDVVRIALYGSDGAGNGVEQFAVARDRLASRRAEESAARH